MSTDPAPLSTQTEKDQPQKFMTKAQCEWCVYYEAVTGFEPIMDDFTTGDCSFYEAASHAVRWFEDHSNDALLKIGRDIPGREVSHG